MFRLRQRHTANGSDELYIRGAEDPDIHIARTPWHKVLLNFFGRLKRALLISCWGTPRLKAVSMKT
jgi:hypothetical protein